MEICKLCVNPNNNDIVCEECLAAHNIINFEDAINFKDDSQIAIEFQEFLKSRANKEVLYAYSGGQDSTAVLFLLKQMCEKYNIKLNVFTIENGFKGVRTWNNIYKVIDYLQLNDNWKIYDIRNTNVTDGLSMKEPLESIKIMSSMDNIRLLKDCALDIQACTHTKDIEVAVNDKETSVIITPIQVQNELTESNYSVDNSNSNVLTLKINK